MTMIEWMFVLIIFLLIGVLCLLCYFVFYVIDNFHAIWGFFAELDDRLNMGFSKTENEGTLADPFPEFKDDNK